MTTCPDLGSWRAFLDGETAVAGPDEHLATCADCANLVARLKADAGFARSRLAVLDAAPATIRTVETTGFTPSPAGRSGWLKGVAAAAVVAMFMATPIGQDTAQAVLSAFRVQRFDVVQVTALELVDTVESLYALGTVEGEPGMEPSFFPTIAAAEEATGLDVPVTESVEGEPLEVLAVPASQLTWTLDADMVADYLEAEGSEVAVPEGLDGTTLVFDRADGVAAIYGESMNTPELLVAVSGPVTLDVAEGGMSLPDVRDFLLALPGLPDSLVAQLRGIDDWRATLPLPIPVDEVNAETTLLGDTEAVEFEVDGFGSGYLWVDGETIVAVAGERGSDLTRVVAEEMAS